MAAARSRLRTVKSWTRFQARWIKPRVNCPRFSLLFSPGKNLCQWMGVFETRRSDIISLRFSTRIVSILPTFFVAKSYPFSAKVLQYWCLLPTNSRRHRTRQFIENITVASCFHCKYLFFYDSHKAGNGKYYIIIWQICEWSSSKIRTHRHNKHLSYWFGAIILSQKENTRKCGMEVF